MLRDVFYYGKKPNVHPREKKVDSLQEARQLATTEHFWIINEHCNYKNFDWSWDFDFLPDEDVWAADHINVWPSSYQKDSGTWLCSTNINAFTVYRADVEPISLKDEITNNWKIIEYIDKDKFDFKWHPDPNDPPYIYVWGNQWYPGTLMPTIEYHCPGAVDRKYITDGLALLLPMPELFTIIHEPAVFDYSWRPNPTSPPYIYVFGNDQYPASVMPTVEFHVEGATERKFVEDIVPKLAAHPTKFQLLENIDTSSFDFSWVPDPTSPPYIYAWGNQWNNPEDKISVIHKVKGATEYKYMDKRVKRLPSKENWNIPSYILDGEFDYSWEPNPNDQPYIYQFGTQWQKTGGPQYVTPGTILASEIKYIDVTTAKAPVTTENWITHEDVIDFDYSWHPDTTEQPYIYQWGNKFYSSDLKPTVEYIVPGATEIKHMSQDVKLAVSDNWVEHYNIDKTKFDFTWRPDPTSPPYIYVWGNKHVSAELKSTIEYQVEGATEYKFMDTILELLPELDKWKIIQPIDKTKFDFTWRPDPTSPPYIYVWGNKHVSAELKSTIEYHCSGATERKYMQELVDVLPELDKWKEVQPIDKTKFDFTWRPDPTSPPYIYVWGNKHVSAELKPTLEYHCPSATERKYMQELVDVLPELDKWKIIQAIDKTKFDLTWRPDPREPAYIYVWGNKHISGELKPTLEYHCSGATERKYMEELVDVLPELDKWKIIQAIDKTKFDLTWRPDPNSPPYIYVFGNQWHQGVIEPTVEYHCPGATDKKYIFDINAIVKSTATEPHWNRLIPIESFDYSWRPDPNSPPYIYVFGNKWNDAATEPSIEYHVAGATEYKYMDKPIASTKAELSFWTINNNHDLETFDFSWRPNPHSPPQIYQWADNGPRYTMPGATGVVLMERTGEVVRHIVNRYEIKTTLEDLINEHPEEFFWVLNPDLNYDKFDFSWRPNEENFRHVNVFGNEYSKNTQTYYVNAPLYLMGHKEFNYVEGQAVEIDSSNLSMFYIDRSNSESVARFTELKIRYPHIQKTRYLNSWVDTINRCATKSQTKLFWVLNSEIDYTQFEFDFYPSPWQEKMTHVFGTQWSHWGNTYMVNKETFPNDTKYVKIIEHLSNLNFVKKSRAVATDCIHSVYLIDHMNPEMVKVHQKLQEKINKQVIAVPYTKNYKDTFMNILAMLPNKKDQFIWIANSICDYEFFDFTYICDPFTREQLHVFPSDKQKYGDTFLINVEKLREILSTITDLSDYPKINFNNHLRSSRLAAPVIISDETHVTSFVKDFAFPYAVFRTHDNKDIQIMDQEPMSLWQDDHKTIKICSTGATQIIAPKEVKHHLKKELYDYPYIVKVPQLKKSISMDVVFMSNGETGAEERYSKLSEALGREPKRVNGVQGRENAIRKSAEISDTDWVFVVPGKLEINNRFDFNWQPDRMQEPKHYIFYATNPLNKLCYGHMAPVMYNKKLVLETLEYGLDFTMSKKHEIVPINTGIAHYNLDPLMTWRTSFREVIKLKAANDQESLARLNVWLTVAEGLNAEYSIKGAKDGIEYFNEVDGDPIKLQLSFEWSWLRRYFEEKYK